MKCRATACSRFSIFFEKALVSLVNRMTIMLERSRIVKDKTPSRVKIFLSIRARTNKTYA